MDQQQQQQQQQAPPGQGQQQHGGAGSTEPESITVSRTEYDALVAARADAESRRYADEAAGRTVEERVAEVERLYRGAAIRGSLADALGSVPFVTDEARRDVMSLLSQEVEARHVDGQIVAWHRPSNRPLSQVPREQLTSRFKYAIKAGDVGGGGGATTRTGPAPDAAGSYATPGHELLAMMTRQPPRRRAALGGDLAE